MPLDTHYFCKFIHNKDLFFCLSVCFRRQWDVSMCTRRCNPTDRFGYKTIDFTKQSTKKNLVSRLSKNK